MVKHNRPLPTLWEFPDELWLRIEPLLNRLDPPLTLGRKREDRRRVLDGIIFRGFMATIAPSIDVLSAGAR
jgi:hypothetical protein